MASSDSSPPRRLRRLSNSSPWLGRLLAPFVGSPQRSKPGQVDEGFFESDPEGTRLDFLTAFPIEISLIILAFLPAADLARLGSVSRAWAVLLADELTWKAKFEAEAGWQLRPSYLASFPTLSALGAGAGADGDGRGRADNDPTGSIPPAASPSKLLSALSLESPRRPTAANDAANSLLAPSYKTLYAKRLWLARRFGHNNEFYDPSSSAESLVGGDQVVVERELSGHTDSIYALAFDGHKVITGSRDRSIKVWDVASGQLLQTVDEAHRASVLCVAFEEVGPGKRGEGAMAVSGGSDGVVTLWDLGGPGLPSRPMTKIDVLTGHTQGVLDVAINADYIVSCSKDTTIRVYSRSAPHRHLYTLALHTGPVNALSLDGHVLASASGDGRVRLWDLRTGDFVRRLKGHERGLACVSLKEGWVVSGSNDQTIKVWKAESGECVRTLKGHTDLVRSLDFSPSAGLIVSGGYDKKNLVWSLATGALIRTLDSSHTSHVFDLALDGSKIVSAGHDKRAFVYDFGDRETGRLFV